ncbi:MAG: hypothetical protein ABI255_04615 [Microbacteriaceae bacterium]
MRRWDHIGAKVGDITVFSNPRASDTAAWRFFGAAPEADGPFDIKPAAAPEDGARWFTNKSGNTIGRTQIAAG